MSIIITWIYIISISCSNNRIEYDSVKIGDQWWMVKNLEVVTFQNGDTIPEARSAQEWQDACKDHQPAWCYYNNDPALGKIYGKLYNIWAVVDPRRLAPKDWHIPTDDEWKILAANCGGKELAGDQLKESGTDHWITPNEGANNQSKFTALPGGSRGGTVYSEKQFLGLGEYTIFWTSTYDNNAKNIDAQVKHLAYFNHRIREYGLGCNAGLSVRCIKN